MAYTVVIESLAKRTIKKLPIVLQSRILKRLKELETNPRPHDVKKLAGYDNIYRVRVSDYRILYEIQDDVLLVLVVKIGHRRDVY